MILREYLYVDTNAVRGVLSQLDLGVVETETRTEGSRANISGGVKGIAAGARESDNQFSTTKALGDAIFPNLEQALEAEGLLEDVSDVVADRNSWESMQDFLPPGKIVRITSPGSLMDSRFIASMLTGFSVTTRGLKNVGVDLDGESEPIQVPPNVKKKQTSKSKTRGNLPGHDASLEGLIPDGNLLGSGEDAVTGDQVRGIIQVMRGMYQPGVHLALKPLVPESGTITIRLQEGRDFLDVDPDVLFARYGVGEQDWTVVGTIGHHAVETPDMSSPEFMDGESVNRAKFSSYVAGLGTLFANLGFTDLAQAPGFTIVPWAVYRTIGHVHLPEAATL